ncbi:MAG: 4-(cytidine 5'-diphospho)-2-C-methyl-D-erythritol kinase, partial [Erysipelotrichaceae bacterium]|nr:4-(cytidine 5'-diphospho)-2-C-methyl-D-erythritol kinase [Erysipelotrichaceae bacterium]
MKIRAYAKINLALDVIGLRGDGYHDLNMVMAPITLHDLIYINPIKEGIEITSNNYRMPVDERNIMYKIAQALIDAYHIDGGVKIHCFKHIPTQAGLGGGSADGAAVMRAMNRIFHLHMSYQDMVEFSKNIGADIPFCVENRLAIVEGIGEKLTFIDESQFTAHLLLVKPSKGVSTKLCFEA